MEAGPCPGAEWIIIRELNEIILKNEKEIKLLWSVTSLKEERIRDMEEEVKRLKEIEELQKIQLGLQKNAIQAFEELVSTLKFQLQQEKDLTDCNLLSFHPFEPHGAMNWGKDKVHDPNDKL